MPPEQIEQERAAFEAWILKEYDGKENAIKRCNEGYSVYQVNDKWKGWLECAGQTGWISIKDRLPEQKANYLIFTPMGRILIAHFYPEMNAWWWYSETVHPTHWHPLPQPPAGETA